MTLAIMTVIIQEIKIEIDLTVEQRVVHKTQTIKLMK